MESCGFFNQPPTVIGRGDRPARDEILYRYIRGSVNGFGWLDIRVAMPRPA
jgi:hypothetical protein